MKNKILLTICLLISFHVKAQVSVEYSVNYGAYNMTDMKNYLSNARTDILSIVPGLEIATTDNFPSYMIHTIGVGYNIDNHEFGLRGSYLTTAGKISYADYSGKISYEIKVNGYRAGLFYRYYFQRLDIGSRQAISFFGGLSPSLIFSKIEINREILPANDFITPFNKSANNADISVLPEIGLLYGITNHLGITLSVGYEINTASSISDLDNHKVEWSGTRIGAGIRYRL
jgi:hypothetical protein